MNSFQSSGNGEIRINCSLAAINAGHSYPGTMGHFELENDLVFPFHLAQQSDNTVVET